MQTAAIRSALSEDRHPSLAVRLFDGLLGWIERSRQRSALSTLDDRLLADIGCDRASAAAEADKPFWRK